MFFRKEGLRRLTFTIRMLMQSYTILAINISNIMLELREDL